LRIKNKEQRIKDKKQRINKGQGTKNKGQGTRTGVFAVAIFGSHSPLMTGVKHQGNRIKH